MKERTIGQKSKDYSTGKGTWVHRLCLGDMVGLSGHVPGAVVTMTAPVSAVHHPDHAAPLLGLQTVLRVLATRLKC